MPHTFIDSDDERIRIGVSKDTKSLCDAHTLTITYINKDSTASDSISFFNSRRVFIYDYENLYGLSLKGWMQERLSHHRIRLGQAALNELLGIPAPSGVRALPGA